MFDPGGGDPLHLPDQQDAVDGFAEVVEFVEEAAEFVTDLVDDLVEALDLHAEEDIEADAFGPAGDPGEVGGAPNPDPLLTDAAPVDPTAVDPTDLIRAILDADPEQLASMEDELRGIIGPDQI
ncbi:hypothetical protein [Kitasatospora sp. NPDC093806]|uniref:hypothetical protein n=1 Tax=Kitasatospora sp. NPDC093806 TaxID=3155075 RepID=UPI00341AB809